MPCSTHNPPTNHHSNYALRDGSRRAAARRMSRKGSRPKDTTVEKGLLGQWGWGAGAPLQSPPPTAVVDGSDGAVKPPTRSVSDSVLPPLAADSQPPLDQAPPPAKPAAHLRRQAEVKQKKPDPEVESRPPKREPPAVEPIEVDVYIMHAASAADDEAAIALCKEIEAKAHRADDSLATAFLDIVSVAHLRIGDKKWRKKAEDERLARLRGAKSFAVLVTSAAVAELRSAHTTESVLLVCWRPPSPLRLRLIATRFLHIYVDSRQCIIILMTLPIPIPTTPCSGSWSRRLRVDDQWYHCCSRRVQSTPRPCLANRLTTHCATSSHAPLSFNYSSAHICN